MTDDLTTVLDEISGVAEKTDRDEIRALADRLTDAPRVFVAGEGRSGLSP